MITEVSARDLGTFCDRWTFFRWQTIYDLTPPETPSTRIGIFLFFLRFILAFRPHVNAGFRKQSLEGSFLRKRRLLVFVWTDRGRKKGFFDTMMSVIHHTAHALIIFLLF